MKPLSAINIGHRAYGVDMESVLRFARSTKAFDHISDSVMRGWLLGVAEIYLFGQREKGRYIGPRMVDRACKKCNGRGWSGRGRPVCTECNGIGRSAVLKPGFWVNGNSSMTHYDNIQWRFLQDSGYKDKYLIAFFTAIRRGTVRRPYVQIRNQVLFDLNSCLTRMALTFGCTCPLTGEYVSREQVRASARLDRDDADHVYPIGFFAMATRQGNNPKADNFVVHPFSKSGASAITKAVRKWRRMNIGPVISEWILAEVMKEQVFTRLAA